MTKPTRTAFTLVELLVAIVLGSILMGTLMGVLRRSFSEITVATRDDPSLTRNVLLLEQLRRDFSNARRLQIGIDRFELEGFIHRDPDTLIATQRPARVTYQIRRDRNQSLLVRSQIESNQSGPLPPGTFTGPFTEAVFAGAQHMLVSSNQVGISSESLSQNDRKSFDDADNIGAYSSSLSSNLVTRSNTVPSLVRVVLVDRRNRTIFDQSFSRQRE
jgi:prepilin-type N-terminal cleavage/methylation domain-containing protein